MDNLTHSLVGVLIARAVPAVSVPRAVALCAIAANIPDIDIVSMYDPAAYLVYHRHITHAVVAIPFMAALAVCFVNVWGRRASGAELGRQWALASVAVASHVALDLTNSYGMRLWLPFSAEWSSWDLFFIIDPLIWAMLAAAVFWPRGWTVNRRTAAVVALLAIVCYGALKLWLRTAAEKDMARALGHRGESIDWRLFPAPFTPLDWLAYGTNEAGRFFFKLPDLSYVVKAIPPNDAVVLAQLRQNSLGAAYLQFARFPVVMVRQGEVTLGDVRFMREGPEGRIAFSCRFDIDEEGRVTNGRFEF